MGREGGGGERGELALHCTHTHAHTHTHTSAHTHMLNTHMLNTHRMYTDAVLLGFYMPGGQVCVCVRACVCACARPPAGRGRPPAM